MSEEKKDGDLVALHSGINMNRKMVKDVLGVFDNQTKWLDKEEVFRVSNLMLITLEREINECERRAINFAISGQCGGGRMEFHAGRANALRSVCEGIIDVRTKLHEYMRRDEVKEGIARAKFNEELKWKLFQAHSKNENSTP